MIQLYNNCETLRPVYIMTVIQNDTYCDYTCIIEYGTYSGWDRLCAFSDGGVVLLALGALDYVHLAISRALDELGGVVGVGVVQLAVGVGFTRVGDMEPRVYRGKSQCAVLWLKYSRYDVKHQTIDQSCKIYFMGPCNTVFPTMKNQM